MMLTPTYQDTVKAINFNTTTVSTRACALHEPSRPFYYRISDLSLVSASTFLFSFLSQGIPFTIFLEVNCRLSAPSNITLDTAHNVTKRRGNVSVFLIA